MKVEQVVKLAYVHGYEDALERVRRLVQAECDKRCAELAVQDKSPGELESLPGRIATAFTRDRILFALASLAEKAAVKRVQIEREVGGLSRESGSEPPVVLVPYADGSFSIHKAEGRTP